METNLKDTGIEVELYGKDGNAILVMMTVAKALSRNGYSSEDVAAWKEIAMSGTYSELLCVVDDTVDIV